MNEFAPIMAALVSSISRAGLNVVDRKQFKNSKACPATIGYWNNCFPVLIAGPAIFLSPASRLVIEILFSIEIIVLSLLIQCVAYSFSLAFRSFRVTDMAVLVKIADITVPLILLLFGFRLLPYKLLIFLPVLIAVFIYCAGFNVVIRAQKSTSLLMFALTIQGVYAFFVGIEQVPGGGVWNLLSVSFVVLIWRFLFSCMLLICGGQASAIFKFPESSILQSRFFLRTLLTLITQVSFIFAIGSNNLMSVWPILNTTGIFGAIFASIFLGEKFASRDFIIISIVFFMSLIMIYASNNE